MSDATLIDIIVSSGVGPPGPAGPPGGSTVPSDGRTYGLTDNNQGWTAVLPLTGGTLSGPLNLGTVGTVYWTASRLFLAATVELDLVSSHPNGAWVYSAEMLDIAGDTATVGIGSGASLISGNTGDVWLYTGQAAAGSSGNILIQSGAAFGDGNKQGDILLQFPGGLAGAERGMVRLDGGMEIKAVAEAYPEIDLIQPSTVDVGATPGIWFNTMTPTSWCGWVMGSRAGKGRWELDFGDDTPETGGNSGSNFTLVRYSDAGAVMDKPVQVRRQDGLVILNNLPTEDPHVVNALYNQGGNVRVSAG